jgi:outer membrane protein insertion porin family
MLAVAVLLAASGAGASSPTIRRVVLSGPLLDEREALLRAVGLRPGGAYSDTVRRRAAERLDRLGYRATVRAHDAPGGFDVHVDLAVHRVVRRIFVEGTLPIDLTDPIFEADVLRQIRIRPGDRLPLDEGALQALLNEQAGRIQEYLGRGGFFDAEVEVRERATDLPHAVDVVYALRKGKRYEVGEIHVSGHSAVPAQDFVRSLDPQWWSGYVRGAPIVGPLLRRPFTVERLTTGMQALLDRYHDLGYIAARVRNDFDPGTSPDRRRHRVDLDVTVRERRHVHLVFEQDGEVLAKPAALREVVTLFESGSYDDIELEQSAREIEHHYQLDGYFLARVRTERTRVGADDERIVFRIARGPKLKVRGVHFAGNTAFPNEDLAEVVETRPYGALGWTGLVSGGYVTTLQLAQDEDRLLDHYRSHGFPDARVRGEAATDWQALGRSGALAAAHATGFHHGNDIVVRFYVHEGPRAVVGAVEFDAPFRTLLMGALPDLELRPGVPFDEVYVAKDTKKLVALLSSAGFLYAEVEPTILRPKPERVVVKYRVRWNAPARFGEIFVRGNFRTRRHVILREMEFEPGDPFDLGRLERSEENLRRLSVFKSARLQLMGSDRKEETLHVIVQVEELYDDAGVIELGAGYSTDNPVFGALGYQHRNLWGRAHAFSLRGEYGPEIGEVKGTYTAPFSHAWSLELSLYGRGEDTERLGTIRVFGGSATLSWKEPLPHLTAFLRYDLRQVALQKPLIRGAGTVDEDDTVRITPRTGQIGPGFVFDRRDSAFSPTCGWQVGGSASYAHQVLLGTSEFAKAHASAQLLVPGSRDAETTFLGCEGRPMKKPPFRAPFTLAQGLRYDHGVPLGGDVVLPEIDRFFAGGDTTVRGFEEDALRTTLVEYELEPGSGATAFRSAPQGGNIRLVHNLELWVPIPMDTLTLFGLPLMTAAFIDTGVVTNSFDGFAATDLRHGAGGALRVLMPFGFLSFEYAVPLDPGRADDPSGRLHINFGLAFQF